MKTKTKQHFQNLLDILNGQELTPEQKNTVAAASEHFAGEKQQYPILSLQRSDLFDIGYDGNTLSDEKMLQLSIKLQQRYTKEDYWDDLDFEASDQCLPYLFCQQAVIYTACGKRKEVCPDVYDELTYEELLEIFGGRKPVFIAESDQHGMDFLGIVNARQLGLPRNDSATLICTNKDVDRLCPEAHEVFGDMLACKADHLSSDCRDAINLTQC